MSQIVRWIFQESANDVVGLGIFVGNLRQILAVERQDLALRISKDQWRMGCDDELNIGIVSQEIMEKQKKAQLALR